jgi:hypothetical protein
MHYVAVQGVKVCSGADYDVLALTIIMSGTFSLAMKRVIIPGLLAGISMLVISFVVNAITSPLLQQEYMSGLFRPWTDPLMMLMFLHPFILGFALAWVWNIVKSAVPGHDVFRRGALFGLGYWIVASIPGMFISYTSFIISPAMVLSWTVSALLQAMVAGIILARMNK